MKFRPLFLAFALLALTASCEKRPLLYDCTVYWQLYLLPKHASAEAIEKTFQETFFGFWKKLNDNTVLVEQTTHDDVRSLTLRLAQLADSKVADSAGPASDLPVEVRVFINYGGSREEMVWKKTYE